MVHRSSSNSERLSLSSANRRDVLRMAGGAAVLGLPAAQLGGLGSSVRSATVQEEGVTLPDELGSDYLVYPETSGTIEFSNCWGGARIPLVQSWIDEFNEIYPDIQIQNNVAECSAMPEQQVASIAGGSPPNVMMIKSDRVAFFADQEAILPLDDFMARDNVDPAAYYSGEFQSRTWQGATYGLPNVTAGALHMLFVNTNLMEQIGMDPEQEIATWQDLAAMAAPAREQGLFVMDPAKISTGMTGHQVLTYANGGRYWDDELTTILWNEPEGVEAAEWMLEFVKMQADSYEDLAIASERANVIQPEDWAPEQYVAMINGSWTFFQLAEVAPHIDYAAYTFPTNENNPESEGNTPTTGGWMFSIANDGGDPAAAWEWIKFTCYSQHACSFVKEQDRPSPVIACNEDPELSENNPYWSVVTDDLSKNVAVPVTTIHPQFVQMWLDMEDAILFENMTPKEALDSYAEEAQAMLDELNANR